MPETVYAGPDALYALVDSAQNHIHREPWHCVAARHGLPYRSLFEGTLEENLIDMAPLLIAMPGPGPAREQAIALHLSLAKTATGLSWLASPLELGALWAHLRRFHSVRADDGSRSHIRYYDTRVLPEWWSVLTPQQRQVFFDRISHWQYHDRAGILCALPLNELCPAADGAALLVLSERQVADLIERSMADSIAMQLPSGVGSDLNAQEIHDRIAVELSLLRAQGITDLETTRVRCTFAVQHELDDGKRPVLGIADMAQATEMTEEKHV